MDATIKPVKLTRRTAGLYSWSNDQYVLSPRYLSANVYRNDFGRADDDQTDPKEWTIKFFHRGKPTFTRPDVWNLRMVRHLLARVDAAWLEIAEDYEDVEEWRVRYAYERIVREAWNAAADVEIERSHAKLGWKH